MDKPTIYEGDKPHIFISCAHANAHAVMQIAEELAARGCRLWYDEGIEAGSERPEYLASRLGGPRSCWPFSPTPIPARTTAGRS